MELEGGTLTSLAGFDGHQGVALVARPRPIADVETILAVARQRDETAFVLVLDSLEDPQNFGTLLRSGEAAGVHGVVYPTHHAAPLSPAAIKAAAGATEHLAMAAVDDLAGTLADLHGRGLRVVAAEEDAPLSYTEADLRGPLVIVVGSEGRGISAAIRRRLDLSVRIPMRGRIGSLNAAVAGSILVFAAAQQRPMRAAQPGPAIGEAKTPPGTATAPAADAQPEKPKRTRTPKAAATEKPATLGQVSPEAQPARPTRKRTKKTPEPEPESPRTDAPTDIELLPGD